MPIKPIFGFFRNCSKWAVISVVVIFVVVFVVFVVVVVVFVVVVVAVVVQSWLVGWKLVVKNLPETIMIQDFQPGYTFFGNRYSKNKNISETSMDRRFI